MALLQDIAELLILVLIAGAVASIGFLRITRRLLQCAKCRYDLAGLPTDARCPECGGFDRRVVPESIRLRWDTRAFGAAIATIAASAAIAAIMPVAWYQLYRINGYAHDLALRIASRGTTDIYFAPVVTAFAWLAVPWRIKVHAASIELALVALVAGAIGGGAATAFAWIGEDVERPGTGVMVGLCAAAAAAGFAWWTWWRDGAGSADPDS